MFFNSLLSRSTQNQTPDSIIAFVKRLQKIYLKNILQKKPQTTQLTLKV